jgi:hypothetical protein
MKVRSLLVQSSMPGSSEMVTRGELHGVPTVPTVINSGLTLTLSHPVPVSLSFERLVIRRWHRVTLIKAKEVLPLTKLLLSAQTPH